MSMIHIWAIEICSHSFPDPINDPKKGTQTVPTPTKWKPGKYLEVPFFGGSVGGWVCNASGRFGSCFMVPTKPPCASLSLRFPQLAFIFLERA